MLASFTLKNKIFPTNIIQGPLAGISCASFRRLIWRYSQPAFTCTEMISCKTLLHKDLSFQKRFIYKDPHEGPLCFQLSANHPRELAEACKMVTGYGADLIDLNCGCPVKKIRKKGAGSSLLMDPAKLYQLITAMKQSTHLPISIKIRVEGNGKEKFHQEIAQVVSDAGVDFLIVHGRHWTEHYETACHYDDIQFFVENLSIPVIGNGDIRCVNSLQKMLATGCAGVMIARAGVGQPWLIANLIAALNQQKSFIPSFKEIAAVFIEHITHLIELLSSEKFALLQARRFAKYYARNLPQQSEFCKTINQCVNLQDFAVICHRYLV